MLLQIVLHSEIASETKNFTVSDVITHISNKMVTRHPHVFGDTKADTSKEVLQNWERLKQKELKPNTSIIDGVPEGCSPFTRTEDRR